MATQWQTFPIEFRGGLISNMSPLQQGTNAVGSATILQNFEPNKEGGYSKIKGYQKYSASVIPGSENVLGVKVFNAGKVVAARKNASNLTQYYYTTGGAWTSIGTASSLGGKIRHAEYNFNNNRTTVFVDGVNYPILIDENNVFTEFNSTNQISDLEGAENVILYKGLLCFSKDNFLFVGIDQQPTTWDQGLGAETFNMRDQITGLAVFRDQLIVFTRNTIQRFVGSSTSDGTISSITNDIGCIDGDTIQEVGGDIMYLADDGVRLLSATDRIGDFALELPSDIIAQDTKKFIASSTDFSSITLKKKAQYRIFSFIESQQPQGAQGLLVTKFSSQGSAGLAWAKTKGLKVNVIDNDYSNTVETVCFAHTDGYVYKMDVGSSFDTQAIEAIYESPFMPISDPQVRKTFYKNTIYIDPTGSTEIDVGLKFDFDRLPEDGVVQPSTQTISSSGTAVFFYGDPSAVYSRTEAFTATAGQTAFVVQDVAYTVGTDKTKVTVTVNGTETSAYTVASVADGSNYDITVTLDTGATLDDEVVVVLIPPSISEVTTYGGELDKVYNLNVIGSGKTVALRISDNSTNPTFTLDTSLLEFRQNDRQ